MACKWYVGLLAICLLFMAGFAAAIVVGIVSPPTEAEATFNFIYILSFIFGSIGWLWGIVLASQNRQWVWLGLIIILFPLSAIIYSVVNLIGGPKTGERRVA